MQEKIIRDITKQELVKVEYGDKISVPKDFIQEVYASLDLEKIKARLIENLENEMADRIANKLVTEFSGDIKQIMSNKELREDLRHYARVKMKAIADGLSQ